MKTNGSWTSPLMFFFCFVFSLLLVYPPTRMYKHLEAVHRFFSFFNEIIKREREKNMFKLNCSLLHALASVQMR